MDIVAVQQITPFNKLHDNTNKFSFFPGASPEIYFHRNYRWIGWKRAVPLFAKTGTGGMPRAFPVLSRILFHDIDASKDKTAKKA